VIKLGCVAHEGEIREAHYILDENLKGRGHLRELDEGVYGGTSSKWILRNEMRVDWTHLAQDRGHLRDIVNTLINLLFSQLNDYYLHKNDSPPWC
jgi:hypothetical protein